MDRLKADKLVNTTDSSKLFHTLTTLLAKKASSDAVTSIFIQFVLLWEQLKNRKIKVNRMTVELMQNNLMT